MMTSWGFLKLLYAASPPLRSGRRWHTRRCRDAEVIGHGCFYPTKRHLEYLAAYKGVLRGRRHPSLFCDCCSPRDYATNGLAARAASSLSPMVDHRAHDLAPRHGRELGRGLDIQP
jgi:hypothetical protein